MVENRLTDEQVAELRRLHGKATGGRWYFYECRAIEIDRYRQPDGYAVNYGVSASTDEGVFEAGVKVDAELASKSHNALPALLDELEALREVVGRLPVTADGVRVTPGMELTSSETPSLRNSVVMCCWQDGMPDIGGYGDEYWRDLYSTYEAAQAAATQGGE